MNNDPCQLKTCNNVANFEISYSTSGTDVQIIKICQSCFLDESNEEFRMFIVEKKSIKEALA